MNHNSKKIFTNSNQFLPIMELKIDKVFNNSTSLNNEKAFFDQD